MPIAAAHTKSDEPPKLTNGKVKPLVGSMDMATARLISACTPNSTEMPKAMYEPYSSSAASAVRTPRATITKYTVHSTKMPMKPSSSPMMAEMKSVCASGKYRTCRPLPRPRPNSLPEPKLITD